MLGSSPHTFLFLSLPKPRFSGASWRRPQGLSTIAFLPRGLLPSASCLLPLLPSTLCPGSSKFQNFLWAWWCWCWCWAPSPPHLTTGFFPKPPQTPLFRCKWKAPPRVIHNCPFAFWVLAFCLLPLLPFSPLPWQFEVPKFSLGLVVLVLVLGPSPPTPHNSFFS